MEYSDGATVVSYVGGSPYEFYGLQADGVYTTQAEADKANLVNSSMQAYQAGDVRFVDQNNDGRIEAPLPIISEAFTPTSAIGISHCPQNFHTLKETKHTMP